MTGRVPIMFEPQGVTVWGRPGELVIDVALAADILIPAPCGGRGICGSCGVRVLSGELAPPDDAELDGLDRAPKGVRLACRARISGPARLHALTAPRAASAIATGALAERVVAGVDLGTTGISAVLIDADTGVELSRATVPNPQARFGADVLSRISAALAGEAGALRDAAEQGLASVLTAASTVASIPAHAVERLVIAGNSAMMGLLAGVDVASLAGHPFTPPHAGGPIGSPAPVRARWPRARVELVPPIAAFVGGDTAAALLAILALDEGAPLLLVDLGTNAEIALMDGERLVVASAAAGPAFEGGGVSCGGPAVPGAIEHVELDGAARLQASVIGGGEPTHLSGSGVVSLVALLRESGHLDADGRLREEGPLASRFARDDAGVLGVRIDDAASRPVVFTQLDVRAVQLAKAAVRVAVDAVLDAWQGSAEPATRIAGAFGSALRVRDLVMLGVLPASLAGRAESVGNAALDGAALVALEPALAEAARGLAGRARHIDLAQDPGFAHRLLAAITLGPSGR